jgi:hypothetical protein
MPKGFDFRTFCFFVYILQMNIVYETKLSLGRAITQVVCRLFPTAAARVRARVRSCGIYGGKVAPEQVSSTKYFGFPY